MRIRFLSDLRQLASVQLRLSAMITDVAVAILSPDPTRPASAPQTALILINCDDGTVGVGEANANAPAIKALVEGGVGFGGWDTDIRSLLVGQEPDDVPSLIARVRSATPWSCRVGLGHVALAGIETALWHLAGLRARKPVWALLGQRAKEKIVPYATVWHGKSDFATTMDNTIQGLRWAVAHGYRAVKIEALIGGTDAAAEIVKLAAAAREEVGADIDLLLDLGYRWRSFAEAAPWIVALDELELTLLEAPFPTENIADYRRWRSESATPVGAGDILASAHEYDALLEGAVDVVQAGAARTGLLDMTRLANSAARAGRQFIPWGWSETVIGSTPNLHHAAVHANVPLVEVAPLGLYANHRLRVDLAVGEPELREGAFDIPTDHGFGDCLDLERIDAYRIDL